MDLRGQIALGTAAVVGTLGLTDFLSDDDFVNDYFPNLIASGIEIGFLALVIDELGRRSTAKRTKPLREAATSAARTVAATALNTLLIPVPEPDRSDFPTDDVFLAAWGAFDLVAPSTHASTAFDSELDRVSFATSQARAAADRCVQVHGPYLEERTLLALVELADSRLIGLLARQAQRSHNPSNPIYLTVQAEMEFIPYVRSARQLWNAVAG